MSNTRHADSSAPLAQERYMSSVEYRELRGISGNAVAAKAALMDHPAKKGLLFFLQALSLKPGGMPKVSADFLAMFRDRIGSKTMLKIREAGETGRPLAVETARQINYELSPLSEDGSPEISDEQRRFDHHLARCMGQSGTLTELLTDLCVNPQTVFPAPDEKPATHNSFHKVSPRWFPDLVPALYEFRARYEKAVRDNFVMTEIGRLIFDTLDVAADASRRGSMVMIEGNSGVGKTTAAAAWCELHLGEARYVSISGITTKTGFFRAVAKTLGLASSAQRTAKEMQSRVEDMLQRSMLVLVIDEAHFLFGGATRIYTEPELVNWLYTAVCNQRVPCGLVCTPAFKERADRARKQTGWNLDQLKRRVLRYEMLPFKPCVDDLTAIAEKLLAGSEPETVKLALGYALTCSQPLPGLINCFEEASMLARKAKREQISYADMDRAITDYCHPTAKAWEVADAKPAARRGRKTLPAPPAPLPTNSAGLPLHRPATAGRATNLTGLEPVSEPTRSRSAALPQPVRSAAADVLP